MAIGTSPFPNFAIAPPPRDRALGQNLPQVPQNPDSGSLVIIDSFEDSYSKANHGNVAAYAARQHGFRGTIYREDIGPDHLQGRQTLPPGSRAALDQLTGGRLSPEDTKKAMVSYSTATQVQLLEDVTGDLDKVRNRGLRDSAINISMSTHPVRQAEDFAVTMDKITDFKRTSQDPNIASQPDYMRENVYGALGIDPAKLRSSNPAIAGPERLRLQQGILDATQTATNSPEVKQAQTTYGQAVRNIEANNNSVGVAAGNHNEALDYWAKFAHGNRVTTAPSAVENILINSDVTTVGATSWPSPTREVLAPYSERSREVDVYASGAVGNGENVNRMKSPGTSFASPRVMAAMATIHGTRPGTPSHAVQNLMKNQLTRDLDGEKVLDFEAAEKYMRTHVF